MNMVSPKDLDLNNPAGWPLIYKVVLWIVMALAIFVLANKIFIKPLEEEIEANKSSIRERESRVRVLVQNTVDLDQYRKRNQELLERLDALLVYLPSSNQIAGLVDSVYTSASDTRVGLANFVPGGTNSEPYYDIRSYDLNTITSYNDFALFAEALNKLDQIMNIDSFTLESYPLSSGRRSDLDDSVDDNAIVVSTQLHTYIYNQDINALREGKLPTGSL